MKEPKIRFNEFKGEWENIPFSKIMNRVSTSGQAGILPGVEFEDIVSGEGVLNKDIYQKICNKHGTLFQNGDILFGKLRPYLKNILLANFEGIAIGDFWVLRSIENDSKYLYSLVNTDSFMKIANTSSGSKMPRADWNLVSSTEFTISPDKNEQKTIGIFFTTLDAQISASTSRLASLKQIKAASLQAMFPQEGETVPKLRFKGFEGEWEKVAIKDIATFSKGRGYSKSDLRVVGIPIILYGRMYTKYEVCITNVDTFVNPLPNSIYSLGNEVIMPASGETPEDISCASAIQVRGIILGGDLNVLRFNIDCYDTTFIALSLSIGKIKKDLSNMAQGKSVVHLHNSDIEKIEMFIPSFAEQRAIASFFTNLDRQITLQSQRLEKLKQIKAACLDKMFV